MTSRTTTYIDDPAPIQIALGAHRGLSRLTRSERRILALLAQGATPKQVAWELHLAISTVRTHIASAKRKADARTVHQLVGAYAETSMASDLVTARR